MEKNTVEWSYFEQFSSNLKQMFIDSVPTAPQCHLPAQMKPQTVIHPGSYPCCQISGART